MLSVGFLNILFDKSFLATALAAILALSLIHISCSAVFLWQPC